ncbi:hypothetical protein NE237_003786 [Protea cynaroides]|uniref:SHSP domain-containing protein n=1 Tax=Protea cynaroides TaxID=273540 RepID=A0A9Q0KHL3_9MAGN|nr:hypothetical protein NE237_003786 [Protea cynaroides]
MATTPKDHLDPNFNPSFKWKEEEEFDIFAIDLPGFKKENIKTQLTAPGNMKITRERDLGDNKWICFENNHQIPDDCDINGLRAKFDSGFLYIIINTQDASRNNRDQSNNRDTRFKKEDIKIQVSTSDRNLKITGEQNLGDNKWIRFEKNEQIPIDCYINGIRGELSGKVLRIIMPKMVTLETTETSKKPETQVPSKTTVETPVSQKFDPTFKWEREDGSDQLLIELPGFNKEDIKVQFFQFRQELEGQKSEPQVPSKTPPQAPSSQKPETPVSSTTTLSSQKPEIQVPSKTPPQAPSSQKPETPVSSTTILEAPSSQKPETQVPSKTPPQAPSSQKPETSVSSTTTLEAPSSRKPETQVPSKTPPQVPSQKAIPRILSKLSLGAPSSEKPKIQLPPQATPEAPLSQKPETQVPPLTTAETPSIQKQETEVVPPITPLEVPLSQKPETQVPPVTTPKAPPIQTPQTEVVPPKTPLEELLSQNTETQVPPVTTPEAPPIQTPEDRSRPT